MMPTAIVGVERHIQNLAALGEMCLPEVTGIPDAAWFAILLAIAAGAFWFLETRAIKATTYWMRLRRWRLRPGESVQKQQSLGIS